MMGVLKLLDSNFNPNDPFSAELLRVNERRCLQGELRDVQVGEVSSTWSRFHMPVHGTTVDRACSIVRDGAVLSFEQLSSRGAQAVRNNLAVLTDVLDIELGVHRYVFLNLGRVHPVDVHPVYFLFPNRLLLGDGVAVALREIVHFGALVSWEAVAVKKQHNRGFSDTQARKENAAATKRFLSNVFSGIGFREEIFPRFLEKNYPNVGRYTASIPYPGTEIRMERRGMEVSLINAWEGPQVMVPTQLKLAEFNPAVLITDRGEERSIARKLKDAGFAGERIFRMSEVVALYKEKYPSLGPYDRQLSTSAYVNLALRDLALLAPNNESGQDYPDSMLGFKERIR